MSADEQFWWNWWVQFATAVGTMGAVVFALFGGWVRYKLIPPKPRISLRSPESSEIPTSLLNPKDPSGAPFAMNSRWFHVRVTNARRWVDATDVRVFLMRVDEPDEAGQFTTIWDEPPLPLKWRHAETENPAATRVVGQDIEADLVAFFKDAATSTDPFLRLQTTYFPNRFDPHRVGRCKLRLVLVARERHVESNYLTIEISWDGKWPERHEKAPRGIVVREVVSS